MPLIAIEEKVAFDLLTYGFHIKRKNIKEKKIGSINPLKFIKKIESAGESEA